MQAPHLKPVTEASPMSPAQRLMRTQGAASTLAEQVITRESARDGGDAARWAMQRQSHDIQPLNEPSHCIAGDVLKTEDF